MRVKLRDSDLQITLPDFLFVVRNDYSNNCRVFGNLRKTLPHNFNLIQIISGMILVLLRLRCDYRARIHARF